MKKREIILTLFFILSFLLTGCTEENKIYKSAIEDYNNKNYLSSMNKFETLGDYKDSKTKYQESVYKLASTTKDQESSYAYYLKIQNYKDSKKKADNLAHKIADEYANNGDTLSAINWLQKTDDQEQIDDMMYQYIINNKNYSDTHTYDFLKELSSKNYKDTNNIYNDLYKVSYNMILNISESDITTDLQEYNNSVWTHDDLYVHVLVTGGYPGQIIKYKLKYETLWGTNNTVGPNTKWSQEYNTEIKVEVNKQYTRHTTGIASNLYYHRFTLYDENNNELCQKTIHTPYSK